MKITEKRVRIKDLVSGFDIAEYAGSDKDVYCYDGKLNCRPSYQRNYVYLSNDYDKAKKVIQTIMKGMPAKAQFPLNVFYHADMGDDTYQLLDGQQRTLSICLFKEGKFTCDILGKKDCAYVGLSPAEKQWFENYEITVYVCSRDEERETKEQFEDSLLEWFEIINVAGEPLRPQELLNATYFGTFVTAAKKLFSNEDSIIFRERYNVRKYFKDASSFECLNRQEFLGTVLKYKAEYDGTSIEGYLSKHRENPNASDLFTESRDCKTIGGYFGDVLNWVDKYFGENYENYMKNINWFSLYNQYNGREQLSVSETKRLLSQYHADDEISPKGGVPEAVLANDIKYLSLRTFDEAIKQRTYKLQGGICPLCAEEQKKNPGKKIKIHYAYKEMQGDHVVPWSRGGKTEEENCCMLCKSHNNLKSASQVVWLEGYMKNLRKKK